MRRTTTLLAAIVVLASGGVSLPPGAVGPARSYAPEVEHLSVSGFQRSEWRQAGGASAYIGGQYVQGGGGARWGEYVGVTDAPTFRRMLEDTGCVHMVDEDASGSLRVEGAADGHYVHGWNTAV